MNFFAFTGLVNGLISTVCGAVVLRANWKSYKNRIYTLYCISLSVWSYCYVAWQMSEGASTALFFSRGLMMGAIFIPVFHYHHILTMFELETPRRRLLVKIFYILSIIYFVSNFTPLFISHVEKRMFFPFWPVPGPLFHPYLFGFILLVILAVLLIWEFWKKGSPMMRNQIAWVGVATIIGYGGGSTNFFLWYNIPIPPYLNVLVWLVIGTTGLTFFTLRLLDIRLFFRDTAVYVLTSLTFGALGSFLIFLFTESYGAVSFILVFSVFVPMLWRPVYDFMRQNVNRTKLGQVDVYLGQVGESIEKIRETTYTYDDLAKNIVNAVLNTFPLSMAAVYIIDMESQELILRAQVGMKSPLVKDLKLNRSAFTIPMDNALVQYFSGRKKVIIREEVQNQPNGRIINEPVLTILERMEAEACVPFIFGEGVKGILVFGKKAGNQMFHTEDINAIYSFGRMGEEIMRYIMGMEHEVYNTALYSHDMNNSTKSLYKVLQLLIKPLGEDLSREDRVKLLEKASEVAVRLNQSFQLHQDRSSLILKSIRGEYDKSPIEITRLIKESHGKTEILAKEKGIKVTIKIPSGSVMVNGNSVDLLRVMDNLLANAMRYVQSGGTISIEADTINDILRVSIRDDGQGIDPDDVERIWKRGWQVKDSKQGASGFGLTIARQIVELHDGKIWVESDGKGKGTKFIFEIPVIQNNRVDTPFSNKLKER